MRPPRNRRADTLDPRTEMMVALDCAIHEMEDAGHQVLLSFARGDPERITAHLDGFLARGVDGLFFWQAEPSRLLAQYRKTGVPIVAIGSRHEQCAGMPLITLSPSAIRLLETCEQFGVRAPEDLSVISFVDAIAAPLLRTPLSSLHSEYDGLGAAAAQTMLAAIDRMHVSDVYVSDSITWIGRASTSPAPRH